MFRKRLKESKKLDYCDFISVVLTWKGIIHKASIQKLKKLIDVEWATVIRKMTIKTAQLVTRYLVTSGI